jgi:pimeloyl-ACP methyl ester carboxylesterase
MQPAHIATIRVEVAPGVSLNVRHRPSTPGGVPFLLVHGLSSNARLWDEVSAELAVAGHPTYAVDLRAHGESDAPPDGYDTATAADDLSAVIHRLELDRPVVAGQSWGGNVVVRLAARHPEQLRALALVDGGWIDLSQFDGWPAVESALRPPDIDGHPVREIRGYLVREHPEWTLDAIEATLANLRVDPEHDTVHRRLPIEQHMRIVRSMWDDPPWPDFPLITVPVLLLPAGDKRTSVEKAAAALGRARIRAYPDGDHDLHAHHPVELAADLLTLVAEG